MSITINGKGAAVQARRDRAPGSTAGRHIHPPPLLSRLGAVAFGLMSYVRGRGRRFAKTPDQLHPAGHRRHGGVHAYTTGSQGPADHRMELLVANHPQDCLVCHRAGNASWPTWPESSGPVRSSTSG